MKSNIAILGTPVSSGNLGVLALGASLLNLCTTAGGPAQITLMIGHKSSGYMPFRINGLTRLVHVVNYRLSPRSRFCDHLLWIVVAALIYRAIPLPAVRRRLSRFTPWIAALEQADLVGDVRGGDSFSDLYGICRFLEGFMVAWTVLLVKGSIVQFPQTFGPFKSITARLLAHYLLNKSTVVIARDKKSQQVAQGLLGLYHEVLLCPDVGFALEAIKPKQIECFPPHTGPIPPGVIGLNINGLMFNGGYTRSNMFGLKLDYQNFLPALAKALLAEHPGELWLVPHTYAPQGSVESDPEACSRLRQALPETLQTRIRIVTGKYDQHEIKGVISQCDFFIGSRMHACIAALSEGVPCVGVGYSMKFEGVFDSVGMHGWVVDGRQVTTEQAVARVLELYRRRELVRDDLKMHTEEARLRLKEVFERLILNS